MIKHYIVVSFLMDVAHQSLITSSLIIEEQIVINKKKNSGY
jgi:hypothetical protein